MRARVTLAATIIVLLVLVGTGVALLGAQSAVLTDNVDETLVRHGQTIEAQLDDVLRTGEIPGIGDDDAFVRVVDAAGEVLASTTGPAAQLASGLELPATDGDAVLFRFVQIPGEPDFRVMIKPAGDLDLVVGTPLDDVRDSVDALTGALLIAMPAASLLLGLLVWLVVGRILGPVERIRQQVAAIGGESLDRRVPVPDSRDEIARLAETMNSMLARIEGAADRQRRFVADASHELRGPLTRIRTELEVDLAHPESADLAATHRSILDDTAGLEALVDDLLTLAKSDERGVTGRRDPVDLDDVVLSEVEQLGPDARKAFDASALSGAQVLGDRAQLARVVRNLLDNALRHGSPPVRISLREDGGDAVLRVSDEGDGIPVELRERVFERFARVDEARSATRSTGLGLAIARDLVRAHGGELAIDPEHEPGACFEVRLPLHATFGDVGHPN